MEIRTAVGAKAAENYRKMKDKLTDHQVLVPKLKSVPHHGAGEIPVITGWTVKNIRKMNLSQISMVMEYASAQLDEPKRGLLTGREERLRGMRN
ncbi:hypothetical protein HZA76_00125 [Candidatus Roizmanbacteria bacterium]|nr:hypothetical protein [Candidatus Roizmanbacteria bacterium]